MFNPFSKQVGEALDEGDLRQLLTRQVAEGLYVEYKREFPSNMKIARSLASFANSYGGWYLVGVESSKPDNLPTSLIGIDLSKFPDPISKVRDIGKEHIDPFPALFPQLINVSSGRSVLVVRIPSDQDKPFMTGDGRLYRRAADSSEPLFEKDRYTIDQMYREGRRFRKVFADLREEQSKSSLKASPTLELLIMPYPTIIDRSETRPVEIVEEFLKRTKEPFKVSFFGVESETNMPLNTGYASGESLIFRQVSPESGHYRGTSIKFDFRQGTASFAIPLFFVTLEDARETSNHEVSAVLDSLVPPLHLLDVGTSVLVIANLVTFYLYWLSDQPSVSEFRFGFTLNGMSNVLPFFDDVEWARHVTTFGLPICLRKRIKSPSRGWYVWDSGLELPLWHLIAALVAYSVGIPESVFGHSLAASAQRLLDSGGKMTSRWESH